MRVHYSSISSKNWSVFKLAVIAFFVIIISILFSLNSYGQSSRENNIFSKEKTTSNKSFGKRKRSENIYDIKVQEYEDRVKEAGKRYAKMEKEMEKPQYSDPMYFGHKKKPKKRPLGKRKFCKECGIVH